TGVHDDDWRLAGTVLDTSKTVVTRVLRSLQRADRQREATQIERQVRLEAASEAGAYQRALAASAASVARKVHRDGKADRRTLARAIAGRYRQLGVTVDDAIARAVEDGLIKAENGGWVPGRRTP